MAKVCGRGHLLNDWVRSCPICAQQDSEAHLERDRQAAKRRKDEKAAAAQRQVIAAARQTGSKKNCHSCGTKVGGWFGSSAFVCQNSACGGVFCVRCRKGIIWKKCPHCGGKTR